eukprot:1915968-Amphidinium_carterae.1
MPQYTQAFQEFSQHHRTGRVGSLRGARHSTSGADTTTGPQAAPTNLPAARTPAGSSSPVAATLVDVVQRETGAGVWPTPTDAH